MGLTAYLEICVARCRPGNKYSPVDNPTSFPCAFVLHATNASQATSYPLKPIQHVRQGQESPAHGAHFASAPGRQCEAHVCPSLAWEGIAQGLFDVWSPSSRNEIRDKSRTYLKKSILTSVRDLSRRRRGTRRTRWLAARRRK